MNMVVFAKAFSEGRNLYLPSVLDADIPTATNLYGFLAPLIISAFISLTGDLGLSALRVSEIITLLVECAGVYFAYRTLYLKTENAQYSMIGAVILDSCYWRYAAFGGAFPDQWGLTLGLFLTYLITKDEKNRKYHPYVYALVIILLFYIKQYFVFWLVGVGVYLLIKSFRDMMKFAVSGIVCGVISMIAVNLIFPLYFSEVFPVAQGSTGSNGIPDSLKQIYEQTLWSYKAFVLILFVYAGFCIIRKIRRKSEGNFRGSVFSGYEFCQMICVFPFSVIISQNEGTRYTYNLQLWWPYVIIFALSVLPVMLKDIRINSKWLRYAILAAVIMYSLWDCKSMLISRPLNTDQKQAWNDAYSILDMYSGNGDILVSPHLSSYCLEKGITTSDYGQAEFNSRESLNAYLNNRLYVRLFPKTERIFNNNISYNERVLEKINNRDYACIALTDAAGYWLEEDDILAAGYRVDVESELVAGGETLDTKFYIPDTSGK